LQFTYLSHHKRRLSYRRSLPPTKETIHRYKLEIISLFLFLRVFFALPDPDPNPDSADQNQCGSMRIRIRIPKKLYRE
jgi:hypothetical protein